VKTYRLPLVLVACLAAVPAATQIRTQAQWTTFLGDASIKVDQSSNTPNPGSWISARAIKYFDGQRGYRHVTLDGPLNRLVWSGIWTSPNNFGAINGWGACGTSRIPRGGQPRDATARWGGFKVTFNVNENRFDGEIWACSELAPARTVPHGPFGPIDFNGRRLGTAAAAPVAQVNTRIAPLTQQYCDRLPYLRSGVRWEIGEQNVRNARPSMAIKPCYLDLLRGDKAQIDVFDSGGRRPQSIVLTPVELVSEVYAPDGSVTAIKLRHNGAPYKLGLPFRADVRAGDFYSDIALGGRFCRSRHWLVELEFSEHQNVTSPMTSLLESGCGRGDPR
jgi:hypothetical protein